MIESKLKILLIVNPQAGKMKSKLGLFDIVNLFSSKGFVITTHCTTAPKDATQTVIDQAPEHDMVVCCGGDGTLNEVISGMLQIEKTIPIGYIPAGSTNDFAKTLGIPLNIKKAADLIFEGKPTYLDIGRLNNETYFTYVASFGAFTKVSYNTPQKLKNSFGHFAYILRGLRHIPEIHPYQVKVTADNFCVNDNFIFGAVTNTTSIGGLVNLNKKNIDLNDGEFEILLVKNPKNTIEVTGIIDGLAKQKYDARHIYFLRCNHVELEFKAPASWTTDGEFACREEKIVIDNIHSAVQIIR